MTGTVVPKGGKEPCVSCPAHKIKPTATILQHSEKAALPSQTKAVNEFHTAEAMRCAAESLQNLEDMRANQMTSPHSS